LIQKNCFILLKPLNHLIMLDIWSFRRFLRIDLLNLLNRQLKLPLIFMDRSEVAAYLYGSIFWIDLKLLPIFWIDLKRSKRSIHNWESPISSPWYCYQIYSLYRWRDQDETFIAYDYMQRDTTGLILRRFF